MNRKNTFVILFALFFLCGICFVPGKSIAAELYKSDFKSNNGTWTSVRNGKPGENLEFSKSLEKQKEYALQLKGNEELLGLINNNINIPVKKSTVIEFDWKSNCDEPVNYIAFSFSTRMGKAFWLWLDEKHNGIINPKLNVWHHAKIPIMEFKTLNKEKLSSNNIVIAFGIYQAQSTGSFHQLSIANFKISEAPSPEMADIRNWTNGLKKGTKDEHENKKPSKSFPLITLSPCSEAPILDGNLNDKCWLNASELSLLPSRADGKLTENTNFLLTYDNDNLYIAATARQSYLDPVLNMLEKTIVSALTRDDPVYADDSIEIFLMPESGAYYQFVINMNGTVYDARNKDCKWNGTFKTATAKNGKSWTVEFAIPLSELGGRNGNDTWRANFYRNNPHKKETGAWSLPARSFHSTELFGYMAFESAGPIIKCEKISVKSGQAKVKFSAIADNELTVTGGTESFTIPGGKSGSQYDIPLKADADGFGQLCISETGKDIFRSPRMFVKSTRSEMTADITCPGSKIELYLNEKLLNAKDNSINMPVYLEDESNVIALKISGDNSSVPTGKFKLAGLLIDLRDWLCSTTEASGWNSLSFNDKGWNLYSGQTVNGVLLLRFTIIKNHTVFAPQLDKNTLFFANNAPMYVGIRRDSPFDKKAIENYTVHLSLPTGLNIPVYEPETRSWFRHEMNKHKFEFKEDTGFNEYVFKYENPLPKVNYVGGYFSVNLVVCPKLDGPQKKMKGTCYMSGKGICEIPNTFNIEILPELKGVQPKNIDLITSLNGTSSRLGIAESELLFPSLRLMGMNVLGVDEIKFIGPQTEEQVRHFVWEAHKNKIQTMFNAFGYNDTALLYNILKEHPELKLKNNLYKRKSWEEVMCPLAYLTSPDVKKMLEEMAVINDRVQYDLEAGTAAACMCEKCRKNFADSLSIGKELSEKEIYEKYKNELIKYQIDINRRTFDFIKETVKRVNPSIKCGLYSSHVNDFLEEHYGMDWRLYKDTLDVPSAGYGEQPEIFLKTRKAFGGKPIVGGFILESGSQYFEDIYDSQNIKSRLFNVLIMGGMRGVNLWTAPELNGIGMTAYADFSRGVATYEDFMKEENEIKNEGLVSGADKENIHIYKKDGEYLYVVLNLLGTTKNVKINIPPETREIYDYYANQTFKGTQEFTVGAYDVLLLHVK